MLGLCHLPHGAKKESHVTNHDSGQDQLLLQELLEIILTGDLHLIEKFNYLVIIETLDNCPNKKHLLKCLALQVLGSINLKNIHISKCRELQLC